MTTVAQRYDPRIDPASNTPDKYDDRIMQEEPEEVRMERIAREQMKPEWNSAIDRWDSA